MTKRARWPCAQDSALEYSGAITIHVREGKTHAGLLRPCCGFTHPIRCAIAPIAPRGEMFHVQAEAVMLAQVDGPQDSLCGRDYLRFAAPLQMRLHNCSSYRKKEGAVRERQLVSRVRTILFPFSAVKNFSCALVTLVLSMPGAVAHIMFGCCSSNHLISLVTSSSLPLPPPRDTSRCIDDPTTRASAFTGAIAQCNDIRTATKQSARSDHTFPKFLRHWLHIFSVFSPGFCKPDSSGSACTSIPE